MVFLVRDSEWPNADLGEKTVCRLFDLPQDVELRRFRYSNRITSPLTPHAVRLEPTVRNRANLAPLRIPQPAKPMSGVGLAQL